MNASRRTARHTLGVAALVLVSGSLVASGGAVAAASAPAPGSTPCVMSADAVEHWTEAGAVLPACVREANERAWAGSTLGRCTVSAEAAERSSAARP
ncbi:hypothetical protein ACT8ZV_19840 [Nocardioides sp. MAHUQ-72]|uniref:hypothetical protein n=1 Tax=unclassified Nocardioides TaxID=2615069 RepID=UPI0036212108